MAEYKAIKFKSKSGADIVIRSAEKADAAAVLALSTAVIGEDIYQLTSPAEFKMTIEAEEKWIQTHFENPNHLILVATLNDGIIGMLDFSNGHRQRISHTGEFGMSVEKTMRDQGIGSLLVSAAIDWSSTNKTLEKIGLSVHSNNERAIALYKKMGFEIEGVRKRDLKYENGQYIDTIVMGRFV